MLIHIKKTEDYITGDLDNIKNLYEEKFKLIKKSEVEKLDLDVVEVLEVCLKSLNEKKDRELKMLKLGEKFLQNQMN